jgi:hypothetical protein
MWTITLLKSKRRLRSSLLATSREDRDKKGAGSGKPAPTSAMRKCQNSPPELYAFNSLRMPQELAVYDTERAQTRVIRPEKNPNGLEF